MIFFQIEIINDDPQLLVNLQINITNIHRRTTDKAPRQPTSLKIQLTFRNSYNFQPFALKYQFGASDRFFGAFSVSLMNLFQANYHKFKIDKS